MKYVNGYLKRESWKSSYLPVLKLREKAKPLKPQNLILLLQNFLASGAILQFSAVFRYFWLYSRPKIDMNLLFNDNRHLENLGKYFYCTFSKVHKKNITHKFFFLTYLGPDLSSILSTYLFQVSSGNEPWV